MNSAPRDVAGAGDSLLIFSKKKCSKTNGKNRPFPSLSLESPASTFTLSRQWPISASSGPPSSLILQCPLLPFPFKAIFINLSKASLLKTYPNKKYDVLCSSDQYICYGYKPKIITINNID